MNMMKSLEQSRSLNWLLLSIKAVFVLVLLSYESRAQYYTSACRSINGKLGTCVDLPSCPLFSGWLKQRPLVKTNLKLIVRYTCSFDKETPKVCCPNENLFVQDDYVDTRVGTPNRREISSSSSGITSNQNKLSFSTSAIAFPASDEDYEKTRNVHSANPFINRDEFPKKKAFNPILFPGERDLYSKAPYNLDIIKPERNTFIKNERIGIPKKDLRYHPNFRLIPKLHECSNAVKLDSLLGTYGGYPWIALIGKKKRKSLDFDHECAGAIINNRYIVTLASCFRRPYTRYVRLGEYDLKTLIDQGSEFLPQSRREDYRIEKITIHPDYDPARGANDIALLRVDRQLALNTTFIRPVCLPFLSEYGIENRLDMNNLDGKAFWVAGWFRSFWEGPQSSILQDGIVEHANHEMCREDYPLLSAYNAKSQICVGGKGRRNSCVPDFGGPLMIPLKVPGQVEGFMEPKYFLLGLLSRGPTERTCQANRGIDTELPTSVYTKMSKYLTWILDNIQD